MEFRPAEAGIRVFFSGTSAKWIGKEQNEKSCEILNCAEILS